MRYLAYIFISTLGIGILGIMGMPAEAAWQAPKFLPAGCTEEMVINKKTGATLYQKNPDAEWPIASLTKVVSAYAIAGTHPDWDSMLTVEDSDLDVVRRNTQGGDSVGLLRAPTGSQIRAIDVLHASLIGSANNSAVALTRLVGPDYRTTVAMMNALSRSKQLAHTLFADPSGIDLSNISTAREYLSLWSAALASPLIARVVHAKKYSFYIELPGGAVEAHTVHNGNKIMRFNRRMLGGKTGYLDESGFNLAFWSRNRKGAERLGVVLGCGNERVLERRVSRLMDF